MKRDSQNKLSLVGSVSLGTGVMIGAGIFVLVGQIAELVGALFPLAFLAGAVVVGWYCNLSSGNFVGDCAARPCWGMPQQGRSKLVFHGVVNPTMENRKWTIGRIQALRRSWNS